MPLSQVFAMVQLLMWSAGPAPSAPAQTALYIQKPIAAVYKPLDSSAVAALESLYVEDYEHFAIAWVKTTEVTRIKHTLAGLGLRASPSPSFGQIRVNDYVVPDNGVSLVSTDLTISDYSPPVGLYLVQFRSVPRTAWITELEHLPARILYYYPDNTYLIAADPGVRPQLQQNPRVRAWAVYQPLHKLQRSLLARSDPRAVTVQLDAGQAWQDTAGRIGAVALDSFDVGTDKDVINVFATLNPSDIRALAFDPAVIAVEETARVAPSDERACQILAGNFTNSGATGAGTYKSSFLNANGLSDLNEYIVNVIDGGLDYGVPDVTHPNHPDIAGRVASWQVNDIPSDMTARDGTGHGTLVAGIIAGDPQQTGGTGMREGPCSPTCTGFFWGTGIAPTARLRITDIFDNFNQSTWSDSASSASKLKTASINADGAGAHFENMSHNLYGDASHPTVQSYDAFAQQIDRLIRNSGSLPVAYAPMTIVQSAANFDTYHSPACQKCVASGSTAKNSISAGSTSEARSPGTCNDTSLVNEISSSSARGVQPDAGRIKPDVVAPGARITSQYSMYAADPSPNGAPDAAQYLGLCPGTASGVVPSTNSKYAYSAGTSFSAPAATGAAVLLSKRFKNLTGANPTPTMIKAMMVIGADRMIGGKDNAFSPPQTLTSSPGAQGWGRLNLKELMTGNPSSYFVDEDRAITPTRRFLAPGTWSVTLTKADPTKPVKAALVFYDPVAALGASPLRVNEMSLYVLQGGFTYCDGRNYDASGFTPRVTSCGARDRDNNVHFINIPASGFTGQFQVQVHMDVLAQPSDPIILDGRGVINQTWALWVWNAQ